jgi:hypothetical protein
MNNPQPKIFNLHSKNRKIRHPQFGCAYFAAIIVLLH